MLNVGLNGEKMMLKKIWSLMLSMTAKEIRFLMDGKNNKIVVVMLLECIIWNIEKVNCKKMCFLMIGGFIVIVKVIIFWLIILNINKVIFLIVCFNINIVIKKLKNLCILRRWCVGYSIDILLYKWNYVWDLMC